MTGLSETRTTPDTRKRLLTSAVEVFAHHGFELATVRDICSKAGANVNAISYHFGDKEGLYIEAVKEAHRAIHEARGPMLVDDVAAQLESNPEQRLRFFIRGFVTAAMAAERRSDVNHLLMLREIGNPTEATKEIAREFVKPRFERLTKLLQTLLPPDVSQLQVRLLGLSVVGQCFQYKFAGEMISFLLTKQEQKQLTVETVSDHITRVTMAAIKEIS